MKYVALIAIAWLTGCVTSTTNVNVVTGHGRLEVARPTSAVPRITPFQVPLVQDPGF